MANLLPLIEKKKIRREYRLRLSIVATVLFAVMVVIAIVLLVPSYILSSFKHNSATSRLADEKQKISDTTEGIDPIRVAKDVNAELRVLGEDPFATPLPADVFATIVGHKPAQVGIKALQYDRESSDGKVVVNGVSRDRETLLMFLQELEAEPLFETVALPISSFVEGEDIQFSIRISITEEKGSSE